MTRLAALASQAAERGWEACASLVSEIGAGRCLPSENDTEACSHGDPWVRCVGLLVAERTGTHAALLEALDDDSEDVAAVAASRLACSRDRETLLRGMEGARWAEALAAQLADRGWLPTEANAAARCAVALGDWDQAVARGAPALAPLQQALEAPDHWVRAEAARALGRLGLPVAIPALLRVSGDGNRRVRRHAVEALARFAHPDAEAAVARAKGDPDPVVRRAADLAERKVPNNTRQEPCPEGRPPVFVVGAQRSGTTLLRLILTCHPDLAIPPEGDFLLDLDGLFPGPLGATDLEHFATCFQAHEKCREWGLSEPQVRATLADLAPASWTQLASIPYRLYAAASGSEGARWGDKNPYYVEHLPRLLELFPAAKIVAIHRDPRDVAASVLPLHFGASTATRAALAWRSAARATDAARASWPHSIHELSYEALTTDPTAAITNLCAFLGLPFSPAMLHFHEENRARGLVPDHRMGWHARTAEPIQTRAVGRWRMDLRPEQVLAIECVAGKELARRGYEPLFGLGHDEPAFHLDNPH
ncbi:MAG: sulfotransferase [Pseudomonadota bacterium]